MDIHCQLFLIHGGKKTRVRKVFISLCVLIKTKKNMTRYNGQNTEFVYIHILYFKINYLFSFFVF